MRDAVRSVIERLPLQFRVLYRQFLLRVIDLESLSIEADIPRCLGQFAAVLITISVFQPFVFLVVTGGGSDLRSLLRMGLHTVQSPLAGTMLIAGLTAVATWDNIFPDLRDAMVLGPLPVRPRAILAAKLASSASLLAIGVLSLELRNGHSSAAVGRRTLALSSDPGGVLVHSLSSGRFCLRCSPDNTGPACSDLAATMVPAVFVDTAARQFCAVPIGVAISTELW
jgi:hypothetical protein